MRSEPCCSLLKKMTYFCTPSLLWAVLYHRNETCAVAEVGDTWVAGVTKWSTNLGGREGDRTNEYSSWFIFQVDNKTCNSFFKFIMFSEFPEALSAIKLIFKKRWLKSSTSINKSKVFTESTECVKILNPQIKIHL